MITTSQAASAARAALLQTVRGSPQHGYVLAYGVAFFALVCGVAVGVVAGRSTTNPASHIAGACMALDMAQAHGALDEPQRKRIVHSLTSVSNPHLDRFPVTRDAMLRACSDVRAAAWSNR